MIQHPNFDPVAISLGSIDIHWYGMMYLVGFIGGAWLGVYRAKKPGSGWLPDQVWDLVFFVAMGVIVGGRLGYCLLYKPAYYLAHPLEIFFIWQGGMSFHGGLLGVIVAMWLFARKIDKSFWNVTDFLAPLVPLGLGAGRIANFINQELWGGVTEMPWGVVFPAAGSLARHPSQLYQALLEGLALFLLLWWYSSKPRAPGRVSGLFLIGYALARIVVEFFRQPDAHLGYLAFGWLTMGQLLSVPMLLFGCWLMFRRVNTVY